MLTNLANQVAATVSSFQADVDAATERWLEMKSPEDFCGMEGELAVMTRQLGDDVAAEVLGARLATPEFQARTTSPPLRALRDVAANPHARILLGVLVIDTLSFSLLGVLFPFIAAYALPEGSAPSR